MHNINEKRKSTWNFMHILLALVYNRANILNFGVRGTTKDISEFLVDNHR